MKRAVAAVWLGAFLLRCLYIWQIADAPFFELRIGDGEAYHLWAQRIAAGDWLGQGVFYQAPLYPYFLAIVYRIFGDGALPLRLIQALIGATSCALLAAAGARLWGRRGIVAGVILAVYPTAIFLDGLLEKSALVTVFTALLLALLAASPEHVRPHRWFATGIVLGLLVLTRENAIFLIVPVFLWITLRRGREYFWKSFPAVAMFLAGCALVLLPVGLRNDAVGGEFHLTTSQFGPNFYIGNHTGANGTYEALVVGHGSAADERDDATRLAEQSVGRQLTSQEVSSFWTMRSFDYIRSQPAEWLKLEARKLALTFNAAPVSDTESQDVSAEWSPLLRVLSGFGFGILFAIAASGAVVTAPDWRRLWLFYAIGATYALTLAVFYVLERYRFPIVIMLMLLATGTLKASGAGAVVGGHGNRERRTIPFLAMTAAVLAMACAHLPVGDERGARATHYFAVATGLSKDPARVQQAIDFYGRALEAAPEFPAAQFGLATLLTRMGRPDEAIPHYKAAIRSWPDYVEAHYNLGVALEMVGQQQEAVNQYEGALRLRPEDAGTHLALSNLGATLANEGRMIEAIEHFTRALALDPNDENVKRNLDRARELAR